MAAAGAGGGPSRLSPSAGPRRPVAAWPRALGSALPRSPPPGVSWRLGLAPRAARGASEWRSRAGTPEVWVPRTAPGWGQGAGPAGPRLAHLPSAAATCARLAAPQQHCPSWTRGGRRPDAGRRRAEQRPGPQSRLCSPLSRFKAGVSGGRGGVSGHRVSRPRPELRRPGQDGRVSCRGRGAVRATERAGLAAEEAEAQPSPGLSPRAGAGRQERPRLRPAEDGPCPPVGEPAGGREAPQGVAPVPTAPMRPRT